MEREDIPPIDVLEAAARRDREETEELLAGFDRPGRGPRRARKKDFVSYYAGDKTAPPSPQGETPRGEPRRAPTFVLPKRPRVPAWLPWAGLASMMIAFGGLVAFLATAEPTPPATGATAVATSKTTITSAPKPTVTTRADDIPPPASVTSEAAEPVPAPAPTSPSSTPSPRPRESAPGSSGPPPREDFIRRF